MWKVQLSKLVKKRELYVPAVTIVMIVVTLGVMHAVSTFRTLDREWHHGENFLNNNAHDIISMAISMAELDPRLHDRNSQQALKEVLDKLVEKVEIAYVGLLMKDGRWVTGGHFPQAPPVFPPQNHPGGENGESYRKIKKMPDGRDVFEVMKFTSDNDLRAVVVGLWMTPVEEVRNQDIRHAIMMGLILLILGSAAFYFIFFVHNYYLVDRTLAEMKSYMENVVESMVAGLITVDTKGWVVSTNGKAVQMLGLEMKQVRGQSLEDVIPSEYLNIYEVIEYGKGIIEKEIDWPVGKNFVPVNVSVTPLRGPEGMNMGAVIILRDMREIRELQQKVRRSERLASLGRLASGVAHEIRNPLSSIKGFAQYFRDKFETGSEDKSYADIMIQEVDRLNRVIAQLLDFSRPKDPRLQPHSLSAILEHPLKLIEGDLNRKGIKVITLPFPQNNIEVDVDSDQMTQALLNIFLNAMESMKDGGELRLKTILNPVDSKVEILISDTGPGISRENLPKIFDPFFSTKKNGTGLGLAITAKLIEAHGGEISVDTEEGGGSTFKIVLPVIKPPLTGGHG